MNTTRIISSSVLALGALVVGVLTLSNVISAEIAVAIVASASLVGFAAYDYSRNVAPLTTRAQLLRPALPALRAAKATANALSGARRVA